MLTWVIYDITEDKSRTKIAKICKGYGLYRVQKSAFLGNLNNNEIDELSLRCQDIMDEEVDSIYVFPMGDEDFKKAKLLGKDFDRELINNEIISKFF